MFFKGYVETKDKKCIEKFKGRTDFKNYEQVQSLPEFAGILATDTILIDIDDFDESEILFKIVQDLKLKCRVYKTTRGKHFLFKNVLVESNRTHATLALGITADIKIGKRNAYSILKFKNKERPILYDEAENEEAMELPKWLLPIKTTMDFLNMTAGDGRNQALFNYILTLQSNDFSKEEARETIKLINKYVLKEPLTDDEVDVIIRDEAFAKPVFFKGATFLFDKFAIFLKNNHHITRINNQLHLYKDGIYIAGQAEIESAMIKHIPQLNRAKRTEVMSYLDIMIRESTKPASANLIAFRNGIYDISEDKFFQFSPEHVITNKIDWDYNPHAYNKLTDEVLNNIACDDKEIRALLEELVGSCLYRENTLESGKAFILTGTKSNGKSTFLNMLKTMLGEKNYSSLDLKKLDDRFSTVMLFGKLANIGDDISDEFKEDASVFKKIVTGETIDAEQKGQPKFDFKPYCQLIFSTNVMPRIKDRTGAVQRRLMMIPFNANFKKTDSSYNPQIYKQLQCQESIEYLIKLGIEGLKRVLKNKSYTSSSKVIKEMEDYEQTNNPILAFIAEGIKIENEPVQKVYEEYQGFLINNGLGRPLAKNEFSKQLQRHTGLTTKQLGSKKINTYIKK